MWFNMSSNSTDIPCKVLNIHYSQLTSVTRLVPGKDVVGDVQEVKCDTGYVIDADSLVDHAQVSCANDISGARWLPVVSCNRKHSFV